MQPICPYPGLRPFNEEESIFFKGRESQVEKLVKRLEEKKFLMVNGASGDGKSSLIFAGVIPYAKAGFFKAKYNNWLVADFRPERSPLKNLTQALCKQLKIEDKANAEKELGYGFSALCDMYKASEFYIDESKPQWKVADDSTKKSLKRKAANLLILVDQFEEFFTNPENYQNGIPSIESQKTVNLLLETYKLAAAQNLPIYVVCTMRSDYIGQCAAFRGLPEAIGYSQFFVPRLKRQEIEQVIEGPAELAGGKISKRLTQTLINNLTEGFDQLPIMQHALNQIWKVAADGNEEMDLIHLAMVGGLSPKMLAAEDKKKFETWFTALPLYKKQLLEKPSLANILNAHANELLEFAADNYKVQIGESIDKEKVIAIIETAFKALTSTDEGRAVRRRTTLEEIANLHTIEKVEVKKVDAVLNIFRQQGNTFLQPFIGEQGENTKLKKEAVFDITHESLIRNWDLLKVWASEENENYTTWKEVEKQLNRWKENKFSKNYLLASGPLSIYKEWYERFKPNSFWIERYENEGNKSGIDGHAKIELLNNFIKKSARYLKRKTTIIIASVSFAFLLLGLLTFYSIKTSIRSGEHMEWAIKEEAIAKNANAEALSQKELAMKAKHEADSLKNIAEKNEIIAKQELESAILFGSPLVMLEKMNVMYHGVQNPISIGFPGLRDEDVIPMVNEGVQLTKVKDRKGFYNIFVPKDIKFVELKAKIKYGNTFRMLLGATPKFRVKNLPEPKIKIKSNTRFNSFYEINIDSLSGINVFFENFDWLVDVKIYSFALSYINDGKESLAISSGSSFSSEQRELIKIVSQKIKKA